MTPVLLVPSLINRHYVLERLEWTGRTPFEIERITARPDGFDVAFTLPVDPTTAGVAANYRLESFTHIYQKFYGSPEVDQTTPRVVSATPAADGRSVQIVARNEARTVARGRKTVN